MLFYAAGALLFGLAGLSGLSVLPKGLIDLMKGEWALVHMVAVLSMASTFLYFAWASGRAAYRAAAPPEAATAPGAGTQPSSKLGWYLVAFMFVAMTASIAAPMFRGLGLKSEEGATKGKLGAVRDAVSRYKSEKESFPPGLEALTEGGVFLTHIPAGAVPPHHAKSPSVRLGAQADDAGGWLYDPDKGEVRVNCTHTDSRGRVWNTY